MKPVVTVGEMKGLDRNTIESAGVPGMVLMERAALKTVEAMEKYLGNKDRVLVVCGNGNNGGDRDGHCQTSPSEGDQSRVIWPVRRRS